MTTAVDLVPVSRAHRRRSAVARRGGANQGAHPESPGGKYLSSLFRDLEALPEGRPGSAYRFRDFPALSGRPVCGDCGRRGLCAGVTPIGSARQSGRHHSAGLFAGAGPVLSCSGSHGWRQFLRRHGGEPRSAGLDARRSSAAAGLGCGCDCRAWHEHRRPLCSGRPARLPFELSPVHAFACAALVLVTIAETGRIPVDNPTTHLELTMIHEAMVLEYSGPEPGADRVGERHQAESHDVASGGAVSFRGAWLRALLFPRWQLPGWRRRAQDGSCWPWRWRCWKAAWPSCACTWCRNFWAWQLQHRFWRWCSLPSRGRDGTG